MEERPVPNGIIQTQGDYYYAENPPGTSIHDLDTPAPATTENAPATN